MRAALESPVLYFSMPGTDDAAGRTEEVEREARASESVQPVSLLDLRELVRQSRWFCQAPGQLPCRAA